MAEVLRRAAGHCPDPETIAAYLDGRLSTSERARVTEHLADCETCYFVMTESAQAESMPALTSEASPDRPKHRWLTSKPVVWSSSMAGALATAAAVWLAVGGGWFSASSDSAALQALVAAVGNERTIEARLTGGFAYGPLRGAVRSGDGSAVSLSPDVRIAAARIEKEALTHRTPQMLRSLGSAYLVMGDVDRAVPVLEEAADQLAQDSQVQSDLAAAYLTRAIQSNQAQDLAKALAMADRAVRVDGRLSEALFNRACALERLSLVDQAQQSWQDYLKLDDRSGWAAEAREHLRALGGVPRSRDDEREQEQMVLAARRRDDEELRKVVRRSPDIARDWAQEQLLGAWSTAVLDGTTQAAGILTAGALVARELAAATSDRFMADAVVVASSASRNGRQAADLARGHQVFRSAMADYNQDRIGESVKQFEAALPPLDALNSPFAAWTRLFLAVGQYYARDFSGALGSLNPLMKDAERRGYVRLLGLAYRLRGLIHVVTGQFAAGWDDYRAAAGSFERVGDVDNEASIQALIAEDLDFLGETELAWSALSKGLSRLSVVRDRRHRHTILQDAALAALREGLPESALYFEQATLDNALQWGRPLAIVNAHMYRGEMQRQVGNAGLAMAALADARQALDRIPDLQLVARDEAQIQLAQGEVEWRTRPVQAVASLSLALETFRRTKTNWPIVRVLLARGRAQLAAGREDLAEADFSAGIDVFEGQRASVTNEALRSASFERPWDLFTEMIRFQAVNRHRPDRALAFAERARARTLLEALSADGSMAPVDPAASRASLPLDVTVVYYAALDDRLLIWTLTREHLTFVDTPVRHADLVHLLDQYRSDMAGPSSSPRDTPSLTRLYDVLIRPVAPALTGGSQIVVVPDGVLHAVPFAALLRREDRRYLVEDRALAVTPSLTVFLAASAKHASPATDWNTALVMGNPQTGALPRDGTSDLPDSEAEAKEVAALYGTSTLLLGARATKTDFMHLAGEFDVVHFAGHAIANNARPELSRLLLAGDDETARSLFAGDIATKRFAATRLVVLGACRTSAGRIRRGEGVFSLARPFLAAGVPTVVASLWDVDDRASHRLLVAFHRALRRGGDVAEALRQAQLELMGDRDPRLQPPSAWAGFIAIGGRTTAAQGQTAH